MGNEEGSGVAMNAFETTPKLIPGGIVDDVTALPIVIKGQPRSPDRLAQKRLLNGPELEESSITDS